MKCHGVTLTMSLSSTHPDVWRGRRAEAKKQGSSDEVIESLHWYEKTMTCQMEGHTEYYNVMDAPNSWTAESSYEEAIALVSWYA